MDRKESREYMANSFLAEIAVYMYLRAYFEDCKLMRIRSATSGNILDMDRIKCFLKDIPCWEKVILDLNEIRSLNLPDYIGIRYDTEAFFVEVKNSKNKIRLSKISEKYAINYLKEKGYHIAIINVKFPNDSILEEKEIEATLQAIGDFAKGRKVNEKFNSLIFGKRFAKLSQNFLNEENPYGSSKLKKISYNPKVLKNSENIDFVEITPTWEFDINPL
ncbi:MAG: hypothetical protein ABIH28_04210 [archaeon]